MDLALAMSPTEARPAHSSVLVELIILALEEAFAEMTELALAKEIIYLLLAQPVSTDGEVLDASFNAHKTSTLTETILHVQEMEFADKMVPAVVNQTGKELIALKPFLKPPLLGSQLPSSSL